MVKVSVPVVLENVPENIKLLLKEREEARANKDFLKSDELRARISELGYLVNDKPGGYELLKIGDAGKKPAKSYLVLFGSGENAPSSVEIYRQLFLTLDKRDLKIALITTPAGFQPNVAFVYQEIKDFLINSLPDFNLTIDIVFANDKLACDDDKLVEQLNGSDIIFTGPGSPTYAAKNLHNSKLIQAIHERVKNGSTLILASAATIAFSAHALPVYEIYKVGESLHWEEGLNFYESIWQPLTVIPHFNNAEGGEHLDTSHCYVGKSRFDKLRSLLPADIPMLGIDEHTAYIVDLESKNTTIKGKGSVRKV